MQGRIASRCAPDPWCMPAATSDGALSEGRTDMLTVNLETREAERGELRESRSLSPCFRRLRGPDLNCGRDP